MIVPGFAQRYPKDEDGLLWGEPLLLESCCTSLTEALAAEKRGADRIELCVDLTGGGFTPPRDLIRDVVAVLTIPVNVLIRPSTRDALCGSLRNRLASLDPSHAAHGPLPLTSRGWLRVSEGSTPAHYSRVEDFSFGDFVYDEADLEQMIEDIDYCKSVGAAGIVVGALTPEGAVDQDAMRRLVAAAQPLPVTFHRAFDVCTEDPFAALDKIIALGCARLLTSGQAPNAWEGRRLIQEMVQYADARLVILAGKGVTSDNLAELAAATGAKEFHGTRIP